MRPKHARPQHTSAIRSAIELAALCAGLCAGLALVGLSAEAHAEGLSVGVGSALPVDLGARLDYEGPSRLGLSVGVGYMPGAYAEGTTGLLVALGALSQSTADLVTETIRSSLVLRAHLSWRPWAEAGFYVAAGYGLVTLGGGTSRGDLMGAALGVSPPPLGRSGDYAVAASVHMIDVELGWRWPLGGRWSLRAALGGAFTVAAPVTVDPPALSVPILERGFADESAAYLRDVIESNVHTPTLTVGVAYTL